MYQPTYHREDRPDVHHALIRAHPLGTMITDGPDGIEANPVPFILDDQVGPNGLLKAHIARANQQWRTFDPQREALVIFMGPQAYISPSWYATKQETGKVVPTWNYACVHVHGHIRVVDDRDWLLAQIRALTDLAERGRPHPWSVDDAPAAFVEAMVAAIIGIEIPINRIEGKWKVSQNRNAADRAGVIAGLTASGDASDRAMADLVARAGRR